MIEVEIKFQPTREQRGKLILGSIFLGKHIIEDVYYDYPDYRFERNNIRLRLRNGSFEIKIIKSVGIAKEITDKEEIKEFLGTNLEIKEFVEKNLKELMRLTTEREKYKKSGFIIDVDHCDFGYDLTEIEKTVEETEQEEQREKTKEEILEFAKSYGMEFKKLPSKRKECLRRTKPEIYKELYGKEVENEFKMK